MKTLGSLDPGLRECGVALFHDGVLVRCALPANPLRTERGGKAWLSMAVQVEEFFGKCPAVFASEYPQIYDIAQQKTDQNDLIEVQGVVGAVLGVLRPNALKTYRPAQWKGQTPKDIHNTRVLAALSPSEHAVLKAAKIPKGLVHNTIDGIGVGLYVLGRIGGLQA